MDLNAIHTICFLSIIIKISPVHVQFIKRISQSYIFKSMDKLKVKYWIYVFLW